MVRGVVLVVRYEQYGAVGELALLALSRIEKILGCQPVLGSGGAGAGTHFNSALVRGERRGEDTNNKGFKLDRCGHIWGKNNRENKN